MVIEKETKMSKLHGNAGLTVAQRIEVRRLHKDEKVSQSELARRFCVSRATIQRWVERDNPEDRSSRPHQGRQVMTDAYREAVLAYRLATPHAGPIRIAHALQGDYPFANRGTVRLILVEAGLSQHHREKKG
jgi:transposase